MKHLVETNLTQTLECDYRELYTDDVKRGIAAYVYGEHGSTVDAERNYVLEKFKKSRAELPDEIDVLKKYDIDGYIKNGYTVIYVDASKGSDMNAGGKTTPVATIEKALSLAKSGRPTAIVIHAGAYSISNTLKINKKLTATPDAPFIITSAGDGEVIVSAAKEIKYEDFSPITELDEISSRIPESVRDKILCADVKSLGWTEDDIGTVDKKHLPLFYIDGKMQDLARFPNNSKNQFDLLYFTAVDETGSVISKLASRLYAGWAERVKYYVARKSFHSGKGEMPNWNTVYTYLGNPKSLYESKEEADADYEKLAAREREGYPPFVDSYGNWNMDMGFTIRLTPNCQEKADRHITEEEIAALAEWKSVSDRNVMYFGNAYEGWEYGHHKIRAIEKKGDYYALTTENGSHCGAGASGNSPTGHNNFYIYNAIEALDTAGEWYMDAPTGKLYVYPTENFANAKIEYSAKVCDLVEITGDNVIINGIHFDKGAKKGVFANYAEGVILQNCTFTNMCNNAVSLEECERSAVIYNEFKYNRASSIFLYGTELISRGIPSFNVVQNNHVDEPIDTQLGIALGGWRNCVSHNTLKLTQITLCIGVSIENVVEYNDIRGGHTDISDSGLVYMCSYGVRGNHIRYNYMHNWRASGNGVYLDDLNQGNYVYCNIIDTTDAKGTKPRGFIYTSTGHDHIIRNNFCIGRSQILEQTMGEKYAVLSEKTRTGVLNATLGEVTSDGKYPLTVRKDGKDYTALTELTDNKTSKSYLGKCECEGYKSLELWCIKTESDTEGDFVALLFENFDGTYLRFSNYNDRINQSWLYYTEKCWLGYRVPAYVNDVFLKSFYFLRYHDVFKRRFPEIYPYYEMYNEWFENRVKDGYRVNALEDYVRSAVANRIDNNVILGVPRPIEYGFPAYTADGVDVDGNDFVFKAKDTNTFHGNYEVKCDTYKELKEMISEYQDKNKPCSFNFRTLLQKAEALQKAQNPEYETVEFVLDKAGIIK